jgi:hypothetical protein
MTRTISIGLVALCALSNTAAAHPFNTTDFSLRTALDVTDSELHAVVIAEVPTGIVLKDLAKGLGINQGFNREQVDKLLEEYNVRLWTYLASETKLVVNGKPTKTDWKPVDKSANGKAAEEFFVYMVETHIPAPETSWGSTLTVEVNSNAFLNVPLFYTADHRMPDTWTKTADDLDTYSTESSEGDVPFSGTGTRKWTKDSGMRNYKVTFSRK